MPKIGERGRGHWLRPRKLKERDRQRQIDAQAFRILQEVCAASAQWAMRHPVGSVERAVSLDNALHLSLVVKEARALAEANPEGNRRGHQKVLWQKQVDRLKEKQ